MSGKLVLQEDDQLRDERFRRSLPDLKRGIRAVFIATPILVGGMYLLMQGIPKEAFPSDFWLIALFLPVLALLLMFGFSVWQERLRRKCVLSASGIYFELPVNRIIPWRGLAEWRIEDSRSFPGHFTVEFRGRNARRTLEITLPDTYSKDDIRVYIMQSIARAF